MRDRHRSTGETTRTLFFCPHTFTHLRSLQSVFRNVQSPHFMLTLLKTAVFLQLLASLLQKAVSLIWQRPLHYSGLINLSYTRFCYSVHAQPMSVTFTLLAYAKCRAILKKHIATVQYLNMIQSFNLNVCQFSFDRLSTLLLPKCNRFVTV